LRYSANKNQKQTTAGNPGPITVQQLEQVTGKSFIVAIVEGKKFHQIENLIYESSVSLMNSCGDLPIIALKSLMKWA
jgi:hypothetical protein